MATRNGVGETNDLVKLLDEIQVQVPEKFKKITEHDTLQDAQEYVDMMIEKGHCFDGHYVKAGKVISEPDSEGKYKILYCPVGELATKCVEKASRMMQLPVLITGEYLCGYTWADSH